MIQAAFLPVYWSGLGLIDAQFTQMEANFSLFFGWPSRRTNRPWFPTTHGSINFSKANNRRSRLEQQGLEVFQQGKSQCIECHQGAEFTAASFTHAANVAVNDNNPDNVGFSESPCRLSLRMPAWAATTALDCPLFSASPARAAGTFKTPTLRNVEFTGPYFHDGGQATLNK